MSVCLTRTIVIVAALWGVAGHLLGAQEPARQAGASAQPRFINATKFGYLEGQWVSDAQVAPSAVRLTLVDGEHKTQDLRIGR